MDEIQTIRIERRQVVDYFAYHLGDRSFKNMLPSVRLYQFGQLQAEALLAMLGGVAFHRYLWGGGYTVSHLKLFNSTLLGTHLIRFLGSEFLIAHGKEEDWAYASAAFLAVKFCLVPLMIWRAGESSFLHAFGIPFYHMIANGVGGYCASFALRSLLTVSRKKRVVWDWRRGISARLAGVQKFQASYTLPFNETNFQRSAPQVDISHPKVNGSEIAYINGKNGVHKSSWRDAACLYWVDVINTFADSDVRKKAGELVVQQTGIIMREANLRGLFIRIADELLSEKHPVEKRQVLVAGVCDALSDCPTTWASVFERLYRDIISDGEGVEWKIRDGNGELKEAVVVSFKDIEYVPDDQHYLVRWRRAFGKETGMESPLALSCEGIEAQHEALYQWVNEALYQWVNSKQAALAAKLLEDKEGWLALFRERYTPERMVAHWRHRLNSGQEGSFVQEVISHLTDRVGIPTAQWDEVGIYDTDRGHFTDKGVCLLLASVGELEPNDEIRALAPTFFRQSGCS